jgi:hypothetical protein
MRCSCSGPGDAYLPRWRRYPSAADFAIAGFALTIAGTLTDGRRDGRGREGSGRVDVREWYEIERIADGVTVIGEPMHT